MDIRRNSELQLERLSKEVRWCIMGYRTMFKMPIGTFPYQLIYGKAYYLWVELEHKAY